MATGSASSKSGVEPACRDLATTVPPWMYVPCNAAPQTEQCVGCFVSVICSGVWFVSVFDLAMIVPQVCGPCA